MEYIYLYLKNLIIFSYTWINQIDWFYVFKKIFSIYGSGIQIFGFRNPATPVMEGIIDLHNYIFIFLITIFTIVLYMFVHILYHYYIIPTYIYDKSLYYINLDYKKITNISYFDVEYKTVRKIGLWISLYGSVILRYKFFISKNHILINEFVKTPNLKAFFKLIFIFDCIRRIVNIFREFLIFIRYIVVVYLGILTQIIQNFICNITLYIERKLFRNFTENYAGMILSPYLKSKYKKITHPVLGIHLSGTINSLADKKISFIEFIDYLYNKLDMLLIYIKDEKFSLLIETRKIIHASKLEIIWTLIPSVILIFIAIPSFSLLYSMEEIVNPQLTLKVIGYQWYWGYEYSANTNIVYNYSEDVLGYNSRLISKELIYDSLLIPSNGLDKNELIKGTKLRLAEVDKPFVIPANVHIRLLITSLDVIHSWTIPNFGVKMDAIPGRLNQVILYCSRPGIYLGQCSELCGVNHGFMPILVHVLNLSDYLVWRGVTRSIQFTN